MNAGDVVRQWHFRVARAQITHFEAARRFGWMNIILGIPAFSLSAFVGTNVFATISQPADFQSRVMVGFCSVGAAIFASLQTFLKYGELAERHRLSGARFMGLKNKIEVLAAMPPVTDQELSRRLLSIERQWTKLTEESPNYPRLLWAHLRKTLTRDDLSGMYKNFEGTLASRPELPNTMPAVDQLQPQAGIL